MGSVALHQLIHQGLKHGQCGLASEIIFHLALLDILHCGLCCSPIDFCHFEHVVIQRSQFQQRIVQEIIQLFGPTQIVLFEPPGEIGTPERHVLAIKQSIESFGTSLISQTLSLYTECNAHSVVICKGVGSKKHIPLMRQFQGNHVRTNECVQHELNVAGPGWDGISTGGQSRDLE